MPDTDDREERSPEMITLAYYLSRCKIVSSDGDEPPAALEVDDWGAASDLFFGSVSGDRSTKRFFGSLMGSKRAFDENRKWQYGQHLEIRNFWEKKTDEELESFVLGLISQTSVEGDRWFGEGITRTEGGQKCYVSKRYERDPEVRKTALKHHGHTCMACDFDFERTYGALGKGFAEVHHMVPLHNDEVRETDPTTDLSVLCSNCHRMVHRKRDTVLEVNELRAVIAAQKTSEI